MMDDTRTRVAAGAQAAAALLKISAEIRARALGAIASALSSRREEIFAANRLDLEAGKAAGLPSPIMKRLAFDSGKLAEVLEGAKSLAGGEDPVGEVLEARELDSGLVLRRITCPIGLVAMIFESRPDALVQMACLAARSGNAIVVKGGSEARNSNRVLAAVIAKAGEEAGLPAGWLIPLETRQEIAELLALDDLVDLVIPRGSKEFVAHIMSSSRIPVLGHSDGVCHVYVHRDADPDMAVRIVVDSKIQYPAACNAAEVLLVNREFASRIGETGEGGLARLVSALVSAGARLNLCPESLAILTGQSPGLASSPLIREFKGENWGVEYLDMEMAVRTVADLDEAVSHINRFGSGHTDCIVNAQPASGTPGAPEADAEAALFMVAVDSASVYRNASTRFADGYRYGLGAEVGISTGKLHARGPMGVKGLLTYKWLLEGSGQTVADYAAGKSKFTHRELPCTP